jgi:tRNA(His) 5'-end guanylyltransferase
MSIEHNLKKVVNLENSSHTKLNPKLHTLIRLCGHNFSKMVKKLKLTKPLDNNFNQVMKDTGIECMDYLNCSLCYAGSDEITYWIKPFTQNQIDNGSELPFSGRIQKIVSLLAGKVSTVFTLKLGKLIGWDELTNINPHFDCRIWQVDTLDQVIDNLKQRIDWVSSNSKMNQVQHYISHKELNGANGLGTTETTEAIEAIEAIKKLKKEKGMIFDENVSLYSSLG